MVPNIQSLIEMEQWTGISILPVFQTFNMSHGFKFILFMSEEFNDTCKKSNESMKNITKTITTMCLMTSKFYDWPCRMVVWGKEAPSKLEGDITKLNRFSNSRIEFFPLKIKSPSIICKPVSSRKELV